MPVYAYTAVTASGRLKQNTVEATSEAEAKTQLHGRGERVVRLSQLSEVKAFGPAQCKGKKPSGDEVASTIRQLGMLIRAGVPLVEGLNGLGEQARSEMLRECLKAVASDVSQGMALSDTFSRFPGIFPSLAVEMARVAEAGGNLAESMDKLADHLEVGAEITRKVRSALAYPTVVLVISAVTVLVMVTFILPRFMKLFDQMGAQLPWTTKALMTVSHVLISRWYLFTVIGGLAFYAARRYARTAAGKQRFDAAALKLPVVGDVVKKIVLSRVIATMSTLLSSGVPMVKTLETSAAAANNEIVKEALLRVRRDVAEGSSTSDALRVSGIFPPLILQMVASGEKTGELPAMLGYVCSMYGRETDAKVKSLTSIIEPVMIVVLGIIVGFIAVSVIVPIYSLVGGVK